ncbi:hypothetical protein BCR33DRAFT_406178 [Rhizoclosmatium globosum]|uniref:Uncharacterized protein n=1 Tax=Rhizoclosmatium globosum TaxID=329046 RepID=A0A1Y2CYV2_9FUNG|nr:hypothetical protein BCR33DRAFT_406178 [Rhizoclosmatium globosum]|eukprot:ORY52024.1 hypothetical protein BCR33DRAFT_406178 [Rhizoclosmatium globosum]
MSYITEEGSPRTNVADKDKKTAKHDLCHSMAGGKRSLTHFPIINLTEGEEYSPKQLLTHNSLLNDALIIEKTRRRSNPPPIPSLHTSACPDTSRIPISYVYPSSHVKEIEINHNSPVTSKSPIPYNVPYVPKIRLQEQHASAIVEQAFHPKRQ